jgi:hypothetical protein
MKNIFSGNTSYIHFSKNFLVYSQGVDSLQFTVYSRGVYSCHYKFFSNPRLQRGLLSPEFLTQIL